MWLGFFDWSSGLEMYILYSGRNGLKLVEHKKGNVSWYVYTHESRLVLLASGMQCKTLSGYQVRCHDFAHTLGLYLHGLQHLLIILGQVSASVLSVNEQIVILLNWWGQVSLHVLQWQSVLTSHASWVQRIDNKSIIIYRNLDCSHAL
jgi:hypothetical protein